MSVPLCRCRVLYIGAAIPTLTKDGLHGIQQPLHARYQTKGSETRGVDTWFVGERGFRSTEIGIAISRLSVWSNGVTITPECAVDKSTNGGSEANGVQRNGGSGGGGATGTFHPIIGLHYCAAVRYIGGAPASPRGGGGGGGGGGVGNAIGEQRFVPLDSLAGRAADSAHPPMFAAIFRRTTGVKVLECHAFICTDERAANALVRCCFHAYAASICLKQVFPTIAGPTRARTIDERRAAH